MLNYYTRIFQAYLGRGTSQLSFWHETPEMNDRAFAQGSREYFMTFADKARYAGPFDEQGIPLLDYRGKIGRQYNPIAIAQYGLACLNAEEKAEGGPCSAKATQGKNLKLENGKKECLAQLPPLTQVSGFRSHSSGFRACADWLVANLEENAVGLKVWHHKFDWEYFRTLRAPWYSGLAQGQGISLLARAFRETGDRKYSEAAEEAFNSMVTRMKDGGVLFVDETGGWWIEEYITIPPTHILNGFIWALWGVHDFALLTGSAKARELWEKGVATIVGNLRTFDSGFWSLYDLAPSSMQNPASEFYHALHIVQLDVMHRLTGEPVFHETAERWRGYAGRPSCRLRAVSAKVLFKLLHY